MISSLLYFLIFKGLLAKNPLFLPMFYYTPKQQKSQARKMA